MRTPLCLRVSTIAKVQNASSSTLAALRPSRSRRPAGRRRLAGCRAGTGRAPGYWYSIKLERLTEGGRLRCAQQFGGVPELVPSLLTSSGSSGSLPRNRWISALDCILRTEPSAATITLEPPFPSRHRVAIRLQGGDAWLMLLEVGPERACEVSGEALEGGVVDRRLAFLQVADQQVGPADSATFTGRPALPPTADPDAARLATSFPWAAAAPRPPPARPTRHKLLSDRGPELGSSTAQRDLLQTTPRRTPTRRGERATLAPRNPCFNRDGSAALRLIGRARSAGPRDRPWSHPILRWRSMWSGG